MRCTTDSEEFSVEAAASLTHNVQPLLHEIRHALVRLLDDDGHTVIDLRSLPLAPGEEEQLLDKLGQGEVTARLQALGPTEIVETRYPGVWVVVHFNSDNEVIGKFIEVCDFPDLLRSQQQDIRQGLEQLQSNLLAATT
ncbi:MAG: hydrogenase expression/formation protein [Gammaproteobacteria bacterium]|jgi:hydrogenase-1 operon protein HyaF